MQSFFEEPPQEPTEEPADVPHWAQLSSHWLLSPLIVDAVLARTPTVVLYIHLVRACPDAFAFRLLAAPAQGHRLNFWSFSMSSAVRGKFANTPFADMFRESRDPLMLGVELADGTRASPIEAFEAMSERREPRGTTLAGPTGGHSGGGSVHTADWVVSLLPEEDVRLVVEWGDEGVPVFNT